MAKKISFSERMEASSLMNPAFHSNVPRVQIEGSKVGRKLGGSHIGTIVEPYFEDGKTKTVEIPLKLWQELMIMKAKDNKDIKLMVAESIVDYLNR